MTKRKNAEGGKRNASWSKQDDRILVDCLRAAKRYAVLLVLLVLLWGGTD